MSAPVVFSPATCVLPDQRGDGRALRVTWHAADDVFVLSTWRGDTCSSSFRLLRADAPDFINALTRGLADASTPWSTISRATARHGVGALLARLRRRADQPT